MIPSRDAIRRYSPDERHDLELYATALEEQVRRLELRSKPFSKKFLAFQSKYRDHPDLFITDCIAWKPGEGATEYQLETARDVVQYHRVSYRSAHGSGKTSLAAWLVLWFSLTRDGDDWKIPTTAGSWRQLTHYLWPEIHLWARRLRWDVIGRAPFSERHELLNQTLKLRTGEAFALASDKVELIEGAHAKHLLYILDEAKAIVKAIWDGIEGAFSAEGIIGEALAFSLSTPGEPQGKFYDISSRKPGTESWRSVFVPFRRILRAGRISLEWAKERKRDWGETSALFQNRVLGEFATQNSDGVIPLSWVEAANERWLNWKESGAALPAFTSLGVDVGRGGDPSTIAHRYDWLIERIDKHATPDTMALVGFVDGLLTKLGGYAIIDVIGVGAGAVDRLRELKRGVFAFNASVRTDARDKSNEFAFVNLRAQAWWGMREALDPNTGLNIALPPSDRLTGELTAPKYKMTSTGLRVEEKDELRKPERLGHSTDEADAVIQAFFPVSGMKGEAGRVLDFYKRLAAEKLAKEQAKREGKQ